MTPYIDIHTHRCPAASPEEVIRIASFRMGVDTVLPAAPFSAGIHPWDAERACESWLETIRTMKPDAIGETGLDRAARVDGTLQREWFVRQRELARLTSGDRITDAALDSAGELLDGAEAYKKRL